MLLFAPSDWLVLGGDFRAGGRGGVRRVGGGFRGTVSRTARSIVFGPNRAEMERR